MDKYIEEGAEIIIWSEDIDPPSDLLYLNDQSLLELLQEI